MALAGALFLSGVAFYGAQAARVPPPTAAIVQARVAGEAIYRSGILPSGGLLTGERGDNPAVSGAAAACINCHGRSGFGAIDGVVKIPPITGRYLFSSISKSAVSELPLIAGLRERPAYRPDTLAGAVRDGIGADGQVLSFLMPRFALTDADLAQLSEYLKSMSPARIPGVERAKVHFATIVTPDADPAKRAGVLAVLEQYFSDQNEYSIAQTAENAQQPIAKRRWELHVWNLSGPASSWEQQLQHYREQQPVYAVVSGIGGSEWGPIHHFCESNELPCLFPNVELPVAAEHDFYSVYFSRGVLLEADLMARALGKAKRVEQVYRLGDVGAAAAAALHRDLASQGITTVEHALPAEAGGHRLAALMKSMPAGDAMVLWLRSADLAALTNIRVPQGVVMLSGLMSDAEQVPLPPSLSGVAHLSYPMDLPTNRATRVQYALGWMTLHHIAAVAVPLQVDTYVACSAVLEMLNHMQGEFPPDYLVERLEAMLEHDLVTGYYPRLSLAPNERFASKGGYMIRFAAGRVVADTDWVVP